MEIATPINSKKFMRMAKNEIKSQKMQFHKAAFNIAVFKTRRLMFQKYGSLNFEAELAESGTGNFLTFYKQVVESIEKPLKG